MALGMKLIGRGIKAVGRVSPSLAGRLAFSAFTRTRARAPQTEKERALFAAALARMAEGQRERLRIGGYDVVIHRFPALSKSPKGRLLFTHGWGSRIAYAQGLVTGLREAGYEVVGIDLPGHGESSGGALHAATAIETIATVARSFGPFDALIGHSFGGYMTALAASGALDGRPLDVPRLVLIAAPADVRRVIHGFSRMLGIGKPAEAALLREIERVTGRPAEASFAPAHIARRGVPTLVLHAPDDKEVHSEAARAYGEAGPHVKVVWLDGLGHRRIVNSDAAIATITSFLVDAPEFSCSVR